MLFILFLLGVRSKTDTRVILSKGHAIVSTERFSLIFAEWGIWSNGLQQLAYKAVVSTAPVRPRSRSASRVTTRAFILFLKSIIAFFFKKRNSSDFFSSLFLYTHAAGGQEIFKHTQWLDTWMAFGALRLWGAECLLCFSELAFEFVVPFLSESRHVHALETTINVWKL